MNIIQLKQISFSYDQNKKVLDNLNLNIPKGSIFGLLGINGAGKTTLIKIMSGLLNLRQGNVFLSNMQLKEDEIEYKRLFYYVPDEYEIYSRITGYEWIQFVSGLYQVPVSRMKKATSKYADDFEMTDALDQLISTYSLGMNNKLGIMLAFIINPPILIMDEPLHGLDPFAIVTYKSILKDYVNNGGTVFFSTHLLDLAQVLCTDIGILSDGKIVDYFKMNDYHKAGELEKHFMNVVGSKKE